MDAQRGMVLVYRQDHPDAEQRVPLRGLRSAAYRVSDARTGQLLGTYTREELAGPGLAVTLPDRFSAAVLTVDPVESP